MHKLKRIISLFRKVASLAQLLLDPYFRTVSGFQVFSFYESVSSWEFTLILLLGLDANVFFAHFLFIKLESFRSESKDENVDERPTTSFPLAMSWTTTHADCDQAKKLVFVRVLQPRSQGLSSPEREGRNLPLGGETKDLGNEVVRSHSRV